MVLLNDMGDVLEEDEPGWRAKDGTLVDGVRKRLGVRTPRLYECSGSARSEEGLKESDELWVKAGVLVFANEDGSVDPLKRGLYVGDVDGGFEVLVVVVDPGEDAEKDEVTAGVVGAEGPLAKAVGVGLVEVRKEKEADGAFGEFGEYASKVDRAVVVRVGRGATFEKRVDPVVSPQAWPSVGGEDFADEFGKWGGECERNGAKEESG